MWQQLAAGKLALRVVWPKVVVLVPLLLLLKVEGVVEDTDMVESGARAEQEGDGNSGTARVNPVCHEVVA